MISEWRGRTILYSLKEKRAVREMDSPLTQVIYNLTCFPDAAEHFHSHYAAHGHGHCHHREVRFDFHNVKFTMSADMLQGIFNQKPVTTKEKDVQITFTFVYKSFNIPAQNQLDISTACLARISGNSR